MRDPLISIGRAVFRDKESRVPTIINLLLILFANYLIYSWRYTRLGPGAMQKVESIDGAAKRQQNEMARMAAAGMPFLRRWNGSTVSLNWGIIREMLD